MRFDLRDIEDVKIGIISSGGSFHDRTLIMSGLRCFEQVPYVAIGKAINEL